MLLLLLRNVVFYTFLILSAVIAAIISLPALLISKYRRYVLSSYAYVVIKLAQAICGIRYRVCNPDFIETIKASRKQTADDDNDGQSILFVSNHQSAWETIFFTYYLNTPVFILKKELMYMPIIGIYLKLTNMLFIDRKNGISSIRQMKKQIKNLPHNRDIVIFPEGRRGKQFNSLLPFKSGLLSIIEAAPNTRVVPVIVHSSGKYWPKGLFAIKKPGEIRIELLPEFPISNINKDRDRKSVVQRLESLMRKKIGEEDRG